MSRRYKGGVISATAPTTSTSAATGVWTLPQQMQAIVGSGWPTSQYFNNSRIILPLVNATYQVQFVIYDWVANTTTTLGTDSQFYVPSNRVPSCVLDPSGNFYIFSLSSTGNSSFKNYAYVAAGSSSISTGRYYSGNNTDYGDQYGQMTWNPSSGECQFNMYPYYVESSSSTAYLMTFAGPSTVTNLGSTPVFGAFGPDMEMARSFSASSGAPSNGTFMLAEAGTSKDGGAGFQPNTNYPFKASSPYTSFSTNNGSSLASLANQNSIAFTSQTNAVIVASGNLLYRNGDNSYTDITSTVGGISSGFAFVTSLGGGAFAAINTSATLYAYGSAPTPSWSTDLSSLVSGRQVAYMIGAGPVLYLVARDTTSNLYYITQVFFNLSTGTYTSIDRSLGVTGTSSIGSYPTAWRYY